MKSLRRMLLLCVVAVAWSVGTAESSNPVSSVPKGSRAPRYFQITMILRYTASVDGPPAPAPQSVTTGVVVSDDKAGSCKVRMGSQIPVMMDGKSKYIDVGTNLDCNNVHLEGDGLALSIVLDTSRVREMVRLKDGNGVETEEPLITQRRIELSVKLPLDTPKVVFDSSAAAKVHPLEQLKPVGGGADAAAADKSAPARPVIVAPKVMTQDPAMQIEMTASEMK